MELDIDPPKEMLSVQIVNEEYIKSVDKIICTLEQRFPGGCFFGSLMNEIYVLRNQESFKPNYLIQGEHSIHWIVPHNNNLPQNNDPFEDTFEYDNLLNQVMTDLFDSSQTNSRKLLRNGQLNVELEQFIQINMRFNIYHYMLFWEHVHGDLEDGEVCIWEIYLYTMRQNNYVHYILSNFMWGNSKIVFFEKFYEWNYEKQLIQDVSCQSFLKHNFRQGCTEHVSENELKKQQTIYNNIYEKAQLIPYFYTHYSVSLYTPEQDLYLQKMFFVYKLICENVMGHNTFLFYRNESTNLLNAESLQCSNTFVECNICNQQQKNPKCLKTRCCSQEICADCILKIFNENFIELHTFACCPFCRFEWSIKQFIIVP